MYVRNLQQEKGIENFLRRRSDGVYRMGLEVAGAIPCPMEETERSIAPGKGCSLVQADPDY
jgi:hypothetical protein